MGVSLAINKDKLLESAQKNLKKKQYSKALKDYQKIVEADPADMRVRQKLAELCVRTGKTAEAYEQFEAIAKYFTSNGFHLKAIAIYKQMQRLDPSQVTIFNRLAELHVKQGLIGNALAEYRNLIDHYERNGMIADEIKILEKMRDLDPGNLNVRVKLAEVMAAHDRPDEGLVELKSVLDRLHDRRDFDKSLKLYKMFLPLYPDNKHLQLGLSRTFYEKGDYQRGATIVETLLKDRPEDPDLLRQLAHGYIRSDDQEKAIDVYKKLLDFDPTDLDNREALVRCQIACDRPEQAVDELEEWKDVFFKAGRLTTVREFYETLKQKLPKNTAVLQTLDSIYELTGEGDKLLDMYSDQDETSEVADDFSPPAEEVLSDTLLGTVDLDFDEETPATSAAEFDVLEEEDLDLQDLVDEKSVDAEGKETTIELDIKDSLADDSDFEAAFSFDDDDADAEPAAANTARGDLKADLEEAEFYLQQGLYDDAEQLCREILSYAPDSEECQHKLDEITALRKTATEGQGSAVAEDGSDDDAVPDLGDFDVDDTLESLQQDHQPQKKIFKTDVDEQIAADDMESHYNLGIAYREMGLHADAISEFEKAQKDPARYVDCQILKSLCLSDTGDHDNAEFLLQQTVQIAGLEAEQKLDLNYELGRLFEKTQRYNNALTSYRDVFDQDNNYRDVADRITALTEIMDKPASQGADGSGHKRERVSFL